MNKETAFLGDSKKVEQAKRQELARINQYRKLLGMDGKMKLMGRLKPAKYKGKKFYTWGIRLTTKISGQRCECELLRQKNGSLEFWMKIVQPDADEFFMLNADARGNIAPIYGVNISVLMKRIIRRISKGPNNSRDKDFAADWSKFFDEYAGTLRKNMKKAGSNPEGEKETYKGMPDKFKPLATLKMKIEAASGK